MAKPKKCMSCGCEAIAKLQTGGYQCCRCYLEFYNSGTKRITLEDIKNKARGSQGRDLEGDLNYRIHLKTALTLIEQAYHAGMRNGKT